MSLLIVTSVEAEARAIGSIESATIIVSGIGRTNAASATTHALVKSAGSRFGQYKAVLCAGIAGALPNSDLQIGDSILASQCIYLEEGLITPTGFTDMAGMGFSLGDFVGNAVPVDEKLLEILGETFPIGPIATVATCSGTHFAALEVVRRTGALAEAMEGAAVVHAARRLSVPAIELRVISNTTGDRATQQWNLPLAFDALRTVVSAAVQQLVM